MAGRKKQTDPKRRTDAERRARQCERLSRLLRVLRCILGSGRWDAKALARELEVSERTVHRIMQTLSMAGVPWYFSKDNECYRVREGFRFPGLGLSHLTAGSVHDKRQSAKMLDRILEEVERLLKTLRQFRDQHLLEVEGLETNRPD